MRGGGRTSSHLPRPSCPSPRHLLPAARPPPLLLCVCLLIIITGSHAQCPLGLGHDGKCYVMQTGTRSWSDARAFCAQLSGTLPVVNDDVTQEVITRLMKEEGAASIWLGAKGDNGDWHWASSGEVIGPQGCFHDSPWSPALEEVATISDMTPGRCMDTCRQAGATYAAVQSKEHCHCGDSYTYGQGGLTGCTIPCPGDNQQYCGGWGKNSVYIVDGGYGNWSYSQPDGANDACAVMDTFGNNRKFADEACFRIKPYICDIPMSSCRAPDVGYYVTAGVCLYVGSDMTWWEARGACAERDGTLLVVKSTSHHDVIRRLLNGTGIDGAHWIGLTRTSWTWSDQDETLSWTGWASRSPSGQAGRCLSVTSSSGFKWVDSACGEQLRTVCAVAALPTTTEPPTTLTPTTTATPSLYPSPTTLNLSVQTTELPPQSDFTSLNSTLPGPSTASSLTTLEQTIEQTTLPPISTTITELLGDQSIELTTVSTQGMTQESSTAQFPSTISMVMTSTQIISIDTTLTDSSSQTLAPSTVSQSTTVESSTEIADSHTAMTIPSTQGYSTDGPTEITTDNLTTELMTSEGETTAVFPLSSTDTDISQSFTSPTAEGQSAVSSTGNVELIGETTSQSPKDLSTLLDNKVHNHTQNDAATSEAITTWPTNNTSSGQTTQVEGFSPVGTETTESTVTPALTTVSPPRITSTNYPVVSSTKEILYPPSTDNGGAQELSSASMASALMTSASDMDDISTQSVSITTPTDSITEESISPETTQNITRMTTKEHGTLGSSKLSEYTSTASIIVVKTVSPSTEKPEKQSTTTISKTLTSEQEPVSPTTEATSTAATTATPKTTPPPPTTTSTTTTEDRLQSLETTSISQNTSDLAGILPPNSRMSSPMTAPPSPVTKSVILSTLASVTQKPPTAVDDVTMGPGDVDLTSPSDVNSTSSSGVPGDAERNDGEDDDGWSALEIGVVAVLVALALGLATSMVVFLSCKKRGGGRCRKKSNKTESVQTATDIFTAGGATSGHVTLGNGSVQNGGSHGLVGNGLSEKQRRRSEQYSLDVTAETKDLTTMEDISVGIGDAKRGKKQKSKRNGSLINGATGTRGRNGPGPPSTWGTIPKYYYGMDKYNGAYAGGSYANQEVPEPEPMQHPLPLRQEVFFRMSQVFADPHQGVTNQDNQQHSGLGGGSSRPSDSTMPPAPPICVLDVNGLNYEASSMYYDAFDPEQNTYSSTFPRYSRNGTPNGGTANGVVSQDPAGPERNRLYEQSGQARPYGQPNYYEKKKSARVPPRTKVPLDCDDESVVGRQDSFNSHNSFTDDTMSTTASPGRSPVMNRAMEYRRSDASRHVSPQSDWQNSPVSENTVTIPSASIHGSQTGSLHRKPRIADVVIPVPPRLPGASQIPPPPPKRSPPAPPPRRSSTSTSDGNAIYAHPNGLLKQNGHPPELQADGRKFFRLNAAEEGITWC